MDKRRIPTTCDERHSFDELRQFAIKGGELAEKLMPAIYELRNGIVEKKGCIDAANNITLHTVLRLLGMTVAKCLEDSRKDSVSDEEGSKLYTEIHNKLAIAIHDFMVNHATDGIAMMLGRLGGEVSSEQGRGEEETKNGSGEVGNPREEKSSREDQKKSREDEEAGDGSAPGMASP